MSFQYCPNCGIKQAGAEGVGNLSKFNCGACGYVLYFNVATTASMLLKCGNEVLFSLRGQNPEKGRLDFPGGFVDAGETVEDAFVREMEEELNWVPDQFQYAFSFPNVYEYQSVKYNTSDIFYYVEVDEKPEITAMDDVAELRWIDLSEVQNQDLAFDSVRVAVAQLKEIFGIQ